MCFKRLHRCLGEVVGAGAGGIELAKQSGRLVAHCFLDQGKLPHLWESESFAEPVSLGLDAALAAGRLEEGPQLGARELRRAFRGEGGGQDHSRDWGTQSLA